MGRRCRIHQMKFLFRLQEEGFSIEKEKEKEDPITTTGTACGWLPTSKKNSVPFSDQFWKFESRYFFQRRRRTTVQRLNIYGYPHRQPFNRVTLNPFVEIASRCVMRRVTQLAPGYIYPSKLSKLFIDIRICASVTESRTFSFGCQPNSCHSRSCFLIESQKQNSIRLCGAYQQPAAPAKYPANRLFTSTSDGCLRTFLLFIFISYRFLVAQIDNWCFKLHSDMYTSRIVTMCPQYFSPGSASVLLCVCEFTTTCTVR